MASPSPSPTVMTLNPSANSSSFASAYGSTLNNAASGSGARGGSGMAWLGSDGQGGGMSYAQAREHGYSDKDLLVNYDQAVLAPLGWNSDQLSRFVNNGIMRKVAGFDVGMGMPEIISAWDDLVKSSIFFTQKAGGKMWTPWDVMNSYSDSANKFGTVRKGDWEYDVATGEKVRYVGPKSKTQTDTRVDLSSAEDVKAITTDVLTRTLGRAPTAAEVAQYKATINAQEQANPTITTQTQTLNDMGEVTATKTNTSGGVSAAAKAQLATDKSKQGPEYGKYQSGTTYYNAMMQMITGGG